jgi:hypothetical protein
MAGIKSRSPPPEVVESWIKAGFGQGEGAEYRPFMYVRDIPSQGASNMVNSRITGRNHHYPSRQEFKVHLLAEYGRLTLDIREQCALLPWEETQSIAEKLGIPHPRYIGTRTPIVVTTDLVLTLERPDGMELIAVSAKLTKDLTPRNLEKLLIERVYWNRRGIRWILATEKNIPNIRAKNLQFFEMALNDERGKNSGVDPANFSRKFEEHHSPHLSCNEIMSRTIKDMGVDVHTGYTLLGMAVWNRTSHIDIDAAPLSHRGSIVLTN